MPQANVLQFDHTHACTIHNLRPITFREAHDSFDHAIGHFAFGEHRAAALRARAAETLIDGVDLNAG